MAAIRLAGTLRPAKTSATNEKIRTKNYIECDGLMVIIRSHMKRMAASLLSIIFVLGIIVFPALHEGHCGRLCSTTGTSHAHHSGGSDERVPADHDADHCPICQLAVTPLIVASTVLAPITAILISNTICLPTELPSTQTFCDLHFACGPPNA